MLLHRQGTHILVRYESELLPDMSIEMRMEPIGGGYEGASLDAEIRAGLEGQA